MTGLYLHPLRLKALQEGRLWVLRVPMTNLGNTKLVERATPADWNAGRVHPNMRRFEDWKDKDSGALFWMDTGSVVFVPAPYAPGDYFVREAWCCEVDPLTSKPTGKILYKADGQEVMLDDGDGSWAENKDGTFASPWRSPVHLLEKHARYILTLGPPVPGKLGEVTEEMMIKEGWPGGDFPEIEPPPYVWYENVWEKMYPKHTDPGTWTWAYPVRRKR